MALQNEKNSRYLLRDWKPENPAFWENKGKHIARRNLWISVSCLLLAFCVWMLFSAVTVNLNKSVLILLPINSFINRITLRFWRIIACPLLLLWCLYSVDADGRFFSTAILIIPCVWLGIAVQNPNTPFWDILSLSLCYAVLQVRTLLRAWAISVSSFQKPNKGALLGLMAD